MDRKPNACQYSALSRGACVGRFAEIPALPSPILCALWVALANIQYEQGLIDFQRVLDSQRALVLQQDTLAESRGNVALNLIALYKALGGGWEMRVEPNLALETVEAETPFEEEALPAELAPMPPPLPAPSDGTAEVPQHPSRRVAS